MRNEELITYVQDFPKKGVQFIDFQNLLKNSITDVAKDLVELLSETEIADIDYVLGVEARGFVLGAAVATLLDKGLVMARKPGKLPHPFEKIEYVTEYSTDSIEIAPIEKGKKVLIVDDVLATGGTLNAVNQLIEKMGVDIVANLVVFNIEAINDFENVRAVKCIK